MARTVTDDIVGKVVETLNSYSAKVPYWNRTEEDLSKLTSLEKETAEKYSPPFVFTANQLSVSKSMTQIIAAPLAGYGLKYDMEGTSWAPTHLANDVILDDFSEIRVRKI